MPIAKSCSLRFLLAFACFLVALPASAQRALCQDVVFPAEHWEEKTPAELGLDPARLDAVAAALGGRGCIIKDGYLIKSWGSQSERSDWFSSAKPVLSTLLLFAVQEGLVPSVDARLVDYGWPLQDKDRPMTFRHLGAMTSGYARPEAPGAAWSYNDYAIQLYQKTLFDRVFKDTPEVVVAAPQRFGALRLEDGLAFRAKNRRISASVRDFARLGWLWLNRGRWQDKQLIRGDLINDCLKPQVPADLPLSSAAATDDYLQIGTYGGDSNHFSKAGPGIYGFNWWFNAHGARHPDELTWPDAPADTFMSLGLRGNNTAMIPSLNLLIVCANGDWGPNEPGQHESVMNQRLRLAAYAGTPIEKQATKQPASPNSPAKARPQEAVIAGQPTKWHKLTLTFAGPESSESAEENPFRDYRLDVTFRHGDRKLIVPGFYAADGIAAESSAASGNCWRVNFVPDAAGEWTWTASFRRGKEVAISDDHLAGEPTACNGVTGKFSIADVDHAAPGFFSQGRLQYVGQRYLRFAETGKYYLKSGADSPENLLAYVDFDDTKPTHQFGPHMLDARPDDPAWQGGRGRNLMGAMNYLAGKGINSIYFLTMNVKGDGKDVWPWTSSQERLRFDCSKLDQWELLFDHLDRLGIALHIVTQEQENDQLLDRGELGPQRRLYYRELVARFGHHLSVVWNLGEENTNTTEQRKAFGEHLHKLDPYQNPVVIHTFPSKIDEVYEALVGFPHIEGASLQTNNTRTQTRRWIEKSAVAGRQWFVCLDEIGPANTGVMPDADDYNHDEVRTVHLWPHFMSGGAGVEWLFGYDYAHDDIKLEDFRSRDHMWDLTRHAVDFFTEHLPFARMNPADELTTRDDDYCLAWPGNAYAVYLPAGGTTEIDLAAGEYTVGWYNPRTGGKLRTGSVEMITGPGKKSLGDPPGDTNRDWACAVLRRDGK